MTLSLLRQVGVSIRQGCFQKQGAVEWASCSFDAITPMKILSKLLLAAGLATLAMAPMAARADYSKCTKALRAQGYFITDVDSDWGRPYDRFEVVKDGREYDLYGNKNTCNVAEKVIKDRHDRYNN